MSLDLHANVTPEMLAHADLLEIYWTYPHIDMAETGRRAAFGLRSLIRGEAGREKAFRANSRAEIAQVTTPAYIIIIWIITVK